MATQLITTCSSFSGGKASVTALPKKVRLTFGGSWATGDKYTFVAVQNNTGSFETFGAGDVTGKEPTFALTLKRKINITADDKWFFSAVDDVNVVNNLNGLGNGYVQVANNFAESEGVVALAPYQGLMSVFSNNNIQTWAVDADPEAYEQRQVLSGIGTNSAESVQPQGDLDVFFLANNGVRSLRARDSSSNAYSMDIGSPVDLLVQAKLVSSTAAEIAAACGALEPTLGQYWLFLKDTLYVVSNFPSAKIIAWGTWDCSYQSAAGTGVAIRNGDSTSYLFKSNITNDAGTATSHGVLAFLASTAALSPIKYIWVYDVTGTTLIEQVTVPAGLAFSGEVYYVPSSSLFTAKQTLFTPQKFEVYQRQVFASTSEGFYVYGGADRQTYDNTVAVAETAWLDADSPANQKSFHGVDVAQDGTWNHYTGTEYLTGQLRQVLNAATTASFDGGKISYSEYGTHIKHRAQTTGVAERCVLSNLLLHFSQSNQK